MGSPTELLKELLDAEQNFKQNLLADDLTPYVRYSTAATEFQEILADNPLQPLAYAGLAYCKAKMGDDPRTVFDLFFASLQFNSTNPIIWSLIADYAKERSIAYSWIVSPCNIEPIKPSKPSSSDLGYELYDVEETVSPPKKSVLIWNRLFLMVLGALVLLGIAAFLKYIVPL